MKTYDYVYSLGEIISDPSILPEDGIFYDIETTGFSKEKSLITLIGCGIVLGNELHIHQWFNDDAISEEVILVDFMEWLSIHPGPLVSFNGDQFDLPFLTAHMEYNDLVLPWKLILDNRESLDLRKVSKGLDKVLGLENGKQKSWEVFLGISREDTYDGGRLIPVYKEYLKSKKESDLTLLLQHNMEDVKGLVSLSVLLSFASLLNGDFKIVGMEENDWQGTAAITFYLELEKSLPVKELIIESSKDNFTGKLCLTRPREMEITIPVLDQSLYHFYDDYQNYYYLPKEDRAVHKSIGAFVDREHRQKATATNCYISRESLFFPVAKQDKSRAVQAKLSDLNICHRYKADYDSLKEYYCFEDLFPNDQIGPVALSYVQHIIHDIFVERIKVK